ncbi:Pex5p [Ascoidea rubescens DSM 1968]|uniref:TPR-like protein n=1 Tax=Ascoidea rubescens DSM 1968 TaxID=1344418 RepID=A0A1D2VN98_9ASCO|nr:TPR-like protein [Ascoidea rubescens DSM 1968]ODV63076.1 TPR-like protein [Ascoidea rubescens DSM 1968]
MSFLAGGSECSASRNPISQFSKQAGGDSLNQSFLNNSSINTNLQQQQQQQQQQNQQNLIRNELNLNSNDLNSMNSFFNNNDLNTNADAFNLQPLSNELNLINQREFHTPGVSLNQSQLQPQLQNQDWSQEFNNFAQSKSQPQPQHQHQHQHQSNQFNPQLNQFNSRLNSFAPRFNSFNPQLNSFNQNIPFANQAPLQTSKDQVNWDDQFSMMENEIKLKENKNGSEKEKEKEKEHEKGREIPNQDQEIDTDNEKLKENYPIILEDKFNSNFDEIWNSLDNQNLNDDFRNYALNRSDFGKYQFESDHNNQFSKLLNPYEIGLQLMENGAKLSEAALAFEAAVKQNPDHIDAWLKLGEVQTANEKEIAGLTALEKCLELDPNNLPALLNLSISYINEGYDNAAFSTLEKWILTKYPGLVDFSTNTNGTLDRKSLNKKVTDLFIKEAQLLYNDPSKQMDPDVQLGLGVLFYANEDFDKTIDCFKTALDLKPDDELLWNRLGAALANSSRSEEAIDAYFKALQIKPTFVRARYNLGVSCINIGCYKEAVEHLLGGLALHKVEKVEGIDSDPNDSQFNITKNQSNSLMETLKRAFLSMDRRDLLEKVKPGMDIEQFRNEFSF